MYYILSFIFLLSAIFVRGDSNQFIMLCGISAAFGIAAGLSSISYFMRSILKGITKVLNKNDIKDNNDKNNEQ